MEDAFMECIQKRMVYHPIGNGLGSMEEQMSEDNITILHDGYEISVPLKEFSEKRWRGIFIPENVIPLDADIFPYKKTQLLTQCEYGGKKGWYITFYHMSFELSQDGVAPIIYIANQRDETQYKRGAKRLRKQMKWLAREMKKKSKND